MKIILKDTTELCNVIYGDNDRYDYITEEGMNKIIDEKIETLNEIYDFMEEHPNKFKNDVYNIGDIINLLECFKDKECIEYTNEDYRQCTECKTRMQEGFCINDGEAYYCSEECLHKNMTEEKYLEMYDNDAAYWTEW